MSLEGRSRSTWAFIPLILISSFLLGFGPPMLVESDDVRLPVGTQQLARMQAGQPPANIGQASLIMDLATGSVTFQRNSRLRVAPASLTKVMTAVVAMERSRLDQEVTITPEDLVDGSTMGLRPGDKVTVEHLLWGLLVPSGNDAAQALARAVGQGSTGRFVGWMNEKARVLGLTDTQFRNPHGLDVDGHYSSAYDLAVLSRYALRRPLFARIVASKEQHLEASRSFYLRNTNQFLTLQTLSQGVNGVKTGFTDRAGDCLIASVDRGGRRVLVVVMGAADRAASASALIEYAYSQFTWATPPLLDPSSAGYDQRFRAAAVMLPLWDVPYLTASVQMGREALPLPFSAPVGVLSFSVGGRQQGRAPVYQGREPGASLVGRVQGQAGP